MVYVEIRVMGGCATIGTLEAASKLTGEIQLNWYPRMAQMGEGMTVGDCTLGCGRGG